MKLNKRTTPNLKDWQVRQVVMNYLGGQARKAAFRGNKSVMRKFTSIQKFLFPHTADPITLGMFDGLWQGGHYGQAIKLYQKTGRPFWQAQQVGKYYERRGLIKKAMAEYEWLIAEYSKMKIFPLPNGPAELLKLGKWYLQKNPKKAKKYLSLYLRTEECRRDPAFYMPHKDQAVNLMKNLNKELIAE